MEQLRFENAITPSDAVGILAQRGVNISERYLRRRARELGACRILGKTMFLFPDDVSAILEASRPCPLKPTSAVKSGTIAGQLPEGGYAALLELRTKQQRKESSRKRKRGNGNVVSMAQNPS